jgi:hypothetical protein
MVDLKWSDGLALAAREYCHVLAKSNDFKKREEAENE